MTTRVSKMMSVMRGRGQGGRDPHHNVSSILKLLLDNYITQNRSLKELHTLKELIGSFRNLTNNQKGNLNRNLNKRINNQQSQNISRKKIEKLLRPRPPNDNKLSNQELLKIARNYYYHNIGNLKQHKLTLNVGWYGADVDVYHNGRKIGDIGSGGSYH